MFYAAFIFLLVFTSGFSIMAVELLGGRIMAPYFGSSIYVWGSIITIFMLALSIGYLLGGQYSLRRPTMAKFGMLYIFSALTVLPMILFADPVMDWVFVNFNDPRYGSLLAAIGLFFIPTIILGMLSPYAIRLLIQNTHTSGSTAGKLYFVSTAGSAAGTLMTSFYFVLWFEVNTILVLITSTLAFCGLLAFAASGRILPQILAAES